MQYLICILASILFGLMQEGASPALGQAIVCPEACPAPEAGIIVESVVKGTQADKLGVLPGDRFLYWTSGSTKGQFETPFDVPYVRFEQASRGIVIVHGISGNQHRIWQFGSDVWGAVVRPSVSGTLLSIAKEAAGLLAAGEPVRAAERFQAAAPLARKQGPTWLAPWFLSRAGQALFDAREWKRADAVYEESIREASAEDSKTRAELLRQRAGGLEYREDLAGAAKYYELHLQDWQNFQPESMVVAQSLLLLANVDLRRFEFKKAEGHLQSALAIVERLAPVSVQMVSVLDDYGILFEERGNFVKAGDYYGKALVIEERYRPVSRQVASILTHLGTMAHWQGNLRVAETYHTRALAVAEKMERNVSQIADILSNLGDCALDRGDPAKAEKYQKRGLLLRQGIDPTSLSVAHSLARLGEIARIRGDLLRAEEYYHQASAMAVEVNAPAADVAKFLVGEAEVQRDHRDLHKAEELYREALGIFDEVMPGSIARAESLADLAGVVRQEQQFDSAARLYQSSLEALTKTSYLAGYGEQRSRYRATHSRYYREYAEMLLTDGQPDVAFQVLDGSRAQTLREMLLETHVDVRQGADPSLLERQSELRSMIHAKSKYRVRVASRQGRKEGLSATDAEIEDLIAKYEQVNTQLRANSPNYAALTEPQPLAVTKVQELLDSSTILLEYALGDERSFVWLVTAKATNVYELPKRAAIERVARRMYRALTTGSEDTDRTAARHPVPSSERGTMYDLVSGELSRMILGPVASRLEHKRLVVVADGALAYVPFAALPSPTDSSLPLIAEHEILSLPSASVLAELRRAREARPQPTREVAVLADPVFEATDERVIQKMAPSTQETLKSANSDKAFGPRQICIRRPAHALRVRCRVAKKRGRLLAALAPLTRRG